jgi:hypothetical protein
MEGVQASTVLARSDIDMYTVPLGDAIVAISPVLKACSGQITLPFTTASVVSMNALANGSPPSFRATVGEVLALANYLMIQLHDDDGSTASRLTRALKDVKRSPWLWPAKIAAIEAVRMSGLVVFGVDHLKMSHLTECASKMHPHLCQTVTPDEAVQLIWSEYCGKVAWEDIVKNAIPRITMQEVKAVGMHLCSNNDGFFLIPPSI